MTATRLQTVMVIHCNHANEIDTEVESALQQLKSAGITLLNQTVLLAGINDSHQALSQLSQKLFQANVLPYYLHLLDRVQGAAHFDVSEANARKIIKELLTSLPGYLVPKLVRESPQAGSKLPIAIF